MIRTGNRSICFNQKLSYVKNAISPVPSIVVICSVKERRRTYARHVVRYRYARKSGTTGERRDADARHATRDFYTRESGATGERIRADALHTIGYRYARKTGTISERNICNRQSYG